MVVWWLLGSLALAGVTVQLPASDTEVVFDDSAQSAVEQGLEALAAGRFEAAGRSFRALADAGGGPDARHLEALAWYQAGQVRLAEKAARQVIAEAPTHGPALGLLGLVELDTGRGDDALVTLEKAGARARAVGDARLGARALANRGLVRLDRGELAQARAELIAARSEATRIGDAGLVQLIDDNIGTLDGIEGRGSGGDTVSQVAALLRTGEVRAARAAVPKPGDHDRRGQVRSLIADALIDRVSGDFDAANVKLRLALGRAREGGMLRETSTTLAELGVLYGLAGRFDLALGQLQEAVGLVAGTSFRLREVAYRVEAGRVAVRLGDLQQARDQLSVARVVAKNTQDPLGAARVAELEGQLAAAAEQPDRAAARLEVALGVYAERGHHADEARVATDLVRLWAGRDEGNRKRWARRAITAFEAARNPAGSAHVEVAAGLGYARAKDLDRALAAFLAAARQAERLDSSRGEQIADHARENAAQALKALGHTDELADEMAQATELVGVMERQEAFGKAEARYEAGLAAFNKGDYTTALDGFEAATKGFTTLGEEGYASTCRRARGWARRNLALRLTPEAALPLFDGAARDGLNAGDAELRAKALVGGAIAAAELGRSGAVDRLTGAADAAEKAGLPAEAGRCFIEIASRGSNLDARAAAARRAFDLRGPDDSEGAYAIYSVAVDAYNAGAYDLSVGLAEEVAPHAGDLAEAVESVRSAASEALRPAR